LVQATINKLLKSRCKLRLQNKSLKIKLKKAQAWCEELRLQIEELNTKLSDKKTNKKCQQCLKFKKQAKSLKAELKSKEVEKGENESQTTEEDLRQAAWIYQFKHNLPDAAQDMKDGVSIADSIRVTAEQAMVEQGMVLEETSGLYYDYKTGYYYDADKSLYYDGNTGTYLKYDQETKQYEVDSMLDPEEVAAQRELKARKEAAKQHTLKRKRSLDLSTNGEPTSKPKTEDQYSDEEITESSIPCIRLVVKASEDERVKLGSLYIVTCKGGTIGSKGEHEVLLPDLGCSKLHARISFQSSTCSYSLRDLGSRNGTWVNGKRLSAAKEQSKDIPIGHNTNIQIGKTKLTCHVHPPPETCLECEPGLIKQEDVPDNLVNGSAGKERQRKQELKDIKRRYGIGVGLTEDRTQIPGFVDRAEERRQVHGVDPVGAKTEVASVDQAIGGKNKGFRMLEKMGWEGGGLGRAQGGIQEPIHVEQRAKQAGLGTNISIQSATVKEKKRNEIWKKTQKRFNKLQVPEVFKHVAEDSEEDDKT